MKVSSPKLLVWRSRCGPWNTGSWSTMRKQTKTGSAHSCRNGPRLWPFVCNRMQKSSATLASPPIPKPVRSVLPRRQCRCSWARRQSGFLRIGQVLRRSAIASDKKRAATKLSECGVAFSGDIRKAWETTPVIPKEKYGAIVRLLTFFAQQLSALINQIVLEKQNTEPPASAKSARIHPAT